MYRGKIVIYADFCMMVDILTVVKSENDEII